MARQVEFDDFLVIEATAAEMYEAVGSPGICDNCCNPSDRGYYIAVLNRWFYPECYEQWKETAIYYKEDAYIEKRNFKRYGELLKCQ